MRRILLPIALLASSTAFAQGQDSPVPPPLPDAVPEGSQQGEMEPEVTIKTEGETRIEEYRTRGNLYMVKITPPQGFPYYLIDTDGDGKLETYTTALDNPNIVQWTLFRW